MTRLITTKAKFWYWVILGFVLGFAIGWIIGARAFVAKEVKATTEGWHDITECVAPTCGTDEGFKTQERTTYQYADPICPKWYHVQNSGNWNQRCHRDYHWMHPEHTAPISCPLGFDRDGANCKKATTEQRQVSCKAPIVECPKDVCKNLEGNQEETPEGYINEDGFCYMPEKPKLCEDTNALNYQSEGDCRYPGASEAPKGPACEAPVWAPTITKVGRVDSDTIYATWTTVKENLHKYLVWYGLSKDNLTWNTIVDGERADISGKELVGKHVWIKVAGYDQGCTGPYSITTDP